MKKEIDIGRCLSDGWKLYKDNFALIFVSSLLASVVGMLTCGILWAPLSIGLLWIIDRIIKDDAQVPTAGHVF